MKFKVRHVHLPAPKGQERASQWQVVGFLNKSADGKVYYSSCYHGDAIEAIKKLLATEHPNPLDIFFNEIDSFDHYPGHD